MWLKCLLCFEIIYYGLSVNWEYFWKVLVDVGKGIEWGVKWKLRFFFFFNC